MGSCCCEVGAWPGTAEKWAGSSRVTEEVLRTGMDTKIVAIESL